MNKHILFQFCEFNCESLLKKTSLTQTQSLSQSSSVFPLSVEEVTESHVSHVLRSDHMLLTRPGLNVFPTVCCLK